MKRMKRKGQAVVEMALALPILLLLVLGVIEMSSLYNQYTTLNHAAVEGARLASLGMNEAGVGMAVDLLLADRWSASAINVSTTDIVIAGGYPGVKVVVSAPLQTITPIGRFLPLFLGSGNGTGTAMFRVEG